MKVNADLHNHLKTRSDRLGINFNRAIDVARERLGAGGIIGVVNFDDFLYEQFSDLEGYERKNFGNGFYVPEKDILVVKGQEVPTMQGHLLVLGLQGGKHLKSGDVEDVIEEATLGHGIIIADHPFYRDGIGKYLEGLAREKVSYLNIFDGIEVYNNSAELWIPFLTPSKANRKAGEFFDIWKERADIGALITSDGHSLAELGKCCTQLEMPSYDEISDSRSLVRVLSESIRQSRGYGRIENLIYPAVLHAGALALYKVKDKIFTRSFSYPDKPENITF